MAGVKWSALTTQSTQLEVTDRIVSATDLSGTPTSVYIEFQDLLKENRFYAETATLSLARASGTEAIPTAVSDLDEIATVNLKAHNGTNFQTTAQIKAIATENHSGAAEGTIMALSVCETGETSLTTKVDFADDINFYQNGGEILTMLQSGEIGIGYDATDAFTSDLAIAGQVSIGDTDPYSANTALTIKSTGASSSHYPIYTSDNADVPTFRVTAQGRLYPGKFHYIDATNANQFILNHSQDGSSGNHQIQLQFDGVTKWTIYGSSFAATAGVSQYLLCNKYYPAEGIGTTPASDGDFRIHVFPLILDNTSSFKGGFTVDARASTGAKPAAGTESISTWKYNTATVASLAADGIVNVIGHYKVSSVQVVTSQQTGVSAMTNLTAPSNLDADTVNVAELADIVGNLINKLRTHGLVAN